MNRFVNTGTLVVTATVAFAACRSAVSQVVRTPYQGVSTLLIDHGPARQWVTGGRVLHIRNWQQEWFDDADDPRIRGNVAVTINLNFQLASLPIFGYGPIWGTVRIENAGGSWVGIYVGERTTQGHSFFRVAMKGEGGYRGLYAVAEYSRMTPNPGAPFQFVGSILQTPSGSTHHD